jgi:hypothetical protein
MLQPGCLWDCDWRSGPALLDPSPSGNMPR